jgi:hypothetical protein
MAGIRSAISVKPKLMNSASQGYFENTTRMLKGFQKFDAGKSVLHRTVMRTDMHLPAGMNAEKALRKFYKILERETRAEFLNCEQTDPRQAQRLRLALSDARHIAEQAATKTVT